MKAEDHVDTARHSEVTLTACLGLPRRSTSIPRHLIQLTVSWWSVDTFSPQQNNSQSHPSCHTQSNRGDLIVQRRKTQQHLHGGLLSIPTPTECLSSQTAQEKENPAFIQRFGPRATAMWGDSQAVSVGTTLLLCCVGKQSRAATKNIFLLSINLLLFSRNSPIHNNVCS